MTHLSSRCESHPNYTNSQAFDRISDLSYTTFDIFDSKIHKNDLQRYGLYSNMKRFYPMKYDLCLNPYHFYSKSPQLSASDLDREANDHLPLPCATASEVA